MLDRQHVVRQELLADQPGVRADSVPGIGGDHVPGQRVPLVQAAQQRRELRDFVRFGPMRVSAITAVSSCSAAASRYGTRPSGPAAPRTGLPSTATPGSQPGAAAGNVTGPAAARQARNCPA
jgi:hypothetical protein